MRPSSPLWLASASPRRRWLLEEAGIDTRIMPPALDDGKLDPQSRRAEAWVMAMAHLKARSAAEELRREQPAARGRVLGADTVCVIENERILGQPVDEAAARTMLYQLRRNEHRTLTGVCLLDLETGAREIFCDTAHVRVGEVTDEMIESYIASGEWRGKAGAYNLSERIAAGWPIDCDGDPATVMGLPMMRLRAMLQT